MRTNRKDIYYSPIVPLELYENTKKEIGEEKLYRDRKYKALREARIAGLFSLALSIFEGGIWWIRVNDRDVAPDFYAFNTRRFENTTMMEGVNASFEVFIWDCNSKVAIHTAVSNKIKNWKAPKMSVICHATKKSLSKRAILKMHEKIKKADIQVLEIWLIAKHSKNKKEFVAQIYPRYFYLQIPDNIPSYFYEPYQFISKHRGNQLRDGGIVSINSEMEVQSVKKESNH